MRRTHTFRMRMSDQEADRLRREADQWGMTRADFIRSALGWERVDATPRNTLQRLGAAAPTVNRPTAQQERPGIETTIEQLAERLRR